MAISLRSRLNCPRALLHEALVWLLDRANPDVARWGTRKRDHHVRQINAVSRLSDGAASGRRLEHLRGVRMIFSTALRLQEDRKLKATARA
jgi:hypothetical protein